MDTCCRISLEHALLLKMLEALPDDESSSSEGTADQRLGGTPNMDWQINKSSLGSRFKQLFSLNQWTDCAFAVGDENVEVINCHKLVLAATSPVFEALFYGSLAEKSAVIEVPDIEPATFRLMLKYMYCDTINFSRIPEAGEVLYCAKKYMLNHLIELCLNYLRDNLNLSTLWGVLAVAEALHEEELQTRCIKIMCQYSTLVWSATSKYMNQSTLSRLLDESCTNLKEIELWNLVSLWAQQECERKDLAITAENKRCIINKSGMFEKIRFFTFTQSEISDIILPSGLLTEEEAKVINSWRPEESDDENKYNIQTLCGLNSNLNCRSPVINGVYNQCRREYLSKRKLYTRGGALKTELLCTSQILLRGFEVFTRIPSNKDYFLGRGNADVYTESLSISIINEEGDILNQSKHIGNHCVFNTHQEIMLSKHLWLSPNKKYTFVFELSDGQYPLCDLSTTAYSKSVYFSFKDYVQFSDSVYCNVKLSFLNSLMFNV